MLKTVRLGLVLALLAPAGAAFGEDVTVRFVNAPPGATIALVLNAGNEIKTGTAAVGTGGVAEGVLDFANVLDKGGRTQVTVYLHRCGQRHTATMTTVGGPAPKECEKERQAGGPEECDCRQLAVWIEPNTRVVTIDWRSAAPVSAGGLSKRAKVGIAAGGGAALLAGVAAGGGGADASPSAAAPSNTTPAITMPPNVTSLHGVYRGTFVTGNSTISGCGAPTTAPCTVTLGGSPNGMPATLVFGDSLPGTGVARPDGSVEFVHEGPANGVARLPGGETIRLQHQGTAANGALRTQGTITVTSSGRCNGAVMSTSVEANKN